MLERSCVSQDLPFSSNFHIHFLSLRMSQSNSPSRPILRHASSKPNAVEELAISVAARLELRAPVKKKSVQFSTTADPDGPPLVEIGVAHPPDEYDRTPIADRTILTLEEIRSGQPFLRSIDPDCYALWVQKKQAKRAAQLQQDASSQQRERDTRLTDAARPVLKTASSLRAEFEKARAFAMKMDKGIDFVDTQAKGQQGTTPHKAEPPLPLRVGSPPRNLVISGIAGRSEESLAASKSVARLSTALLHHHNETNAVEQEIENFFAPSPA